MELVDRKTASLFSACARLGALTTGADEATETRLGEFAWNLGMAFQLVDDVLDFTSRESVLGKPVGNDLREVKVTLPLVYALADAPQTDKQLVETVLLEEGYENVPFSQILRLIEERNGVARARERANSFIEKAKAIIAEFPDSPYRRALAAVAELVTERDR